MQVKKTIESLLPLLRVEANLVAITGNVMDIRNSVMDDISSCIQTPFKSSDLTNVL